MTLRSHDQYNTTIYGLHDRYRGVHGHRRVVFMNAEDMVEARLENAADASTSPVISTEKNGQQRTGCWCLTRFPEET